MLILVLMLCLATAVYVALRRRDVLSLYLLGMSVCNLVMLAGIVIYIAKMGGTAAQQRAFLFLVPELQTWLQFLPLSMDKLGYVVATYVTVVDLGGTPPSEPTGPPAEAQEWVLIIKTNVNIRSGPSTKTQSLGMANKGDKFEYLGEENGWYALTYNGQKAYVRQDMAEVVKE